MTQRKKISPSLRFSIFQRDGFRCQYCGRSAKHAELCIDHMKPLAEGGADDRSNFITACDVCNSGKGATYAEPPGRMIEMRQTVKADLERSQYHFEAGRTYVDNGNTIADVHFRHFLKTGAAIEVEECEDAIVVAD